MSRIQLLISLLLLAGVGAFFASCSLDTPNAPEHDNPMDSLNPAAPRAPDNLFGSVLSETAVELGWQDNSGNETSFVVLGSPQADSAWTISDTITNGNHTTLTGLTPATAYRFSVIAFNNSGTSARASILSLNTAQTRPTAPDSLKLVHANSTSILVTWKDCSANEEHFEIFLGTDSLHLDLIDRVAADTVSVLLDSLTAFQRYWVGIRAINDFGVSPNLNHPSMIPADVPLVPPTILSAGAISETSVTLAWVDSNETVENFRLWESVGDSTHFGDILGIPSDVFTVNIPNRQPNTVYYYRVVARNQLGASEPSSIVRVITSRTAPFSPSNVRATLVNELDVVVNWQDNSSVEVAFEVNEAQTAGQVERVITVPANFTTASFRGRLPGVRYFYSVRAFNDDGVSNWSAALPLVVGAVVPLPPDSLVSTPLDTRRIELRWSDHSRIETGFVVQASTGGAFRKYGEIGADTTTLIIDTLRSKVSYAFTVKAVNGYGSSSWSNQATSTTYGPPPAPPTFSATGVTANQVHLAWSVAGGSDHTSFQVEDSIDGQAGWVVVDSAIGLESRSYEVRNCTKYVRHFFRIRAVNEWGVSAWVESDPAYALVNIACLCMNDGGVDVLDVTDPSHPFSIGSADTPGLAQQAVFYGDYALIADSYGGLQVILMGKPDQPEIIGSLDGVGRVYGVVADNNAVYLAAGDSGFVTVNLNVPASPRLLGRVSLAPGSARDLVVSGGYAYVASTSAGITKVNISSLSNPTISAGLTTGSSVQGICSNGALFTAEYASGFRSVTLGMSEIGAAALPGFAVDVADNGHYCYVACFNRGLSIVHLPDLSHPSLVSNLPTPDDCWSVTRFGNLLFACIDNAGLRIYDVSTPSSPTVISTYQSRTPARGVAVKTYR